MCIRDRPFSSVIYFESAMILIIQNAKLMATSPHILYRTQIFSLKKRHIISFKIARQILRTVSYTHLDVYKRQAHKYGSMVANIKDYTKMAKNVDLANIDGLMVAHMKAVGSITR